MKKQLFLIIFSTCCNSLIWGQDTTALKYVYKIRIPATSKHSNLIQTGFKLKGQDGLITALHGVSDGTTFAASNEFGGYEKLILTSVDIDDDLALLTSPDLKKDFSGFKSQIINASQIRGTPFEFSICGYAGSSSAHFDGATILLQNGVFQPLFRVVKEIAQSFIVDRKSPKADIIILDVNGSVGPGHSGAPLLTKDNIVIGIIDGGAENKNGWAIPIINIKWSSINDNMVKENMRILNQHKIPLNQLFALEMDIPEKSLKKVISQSGDGDYVTILEGIENAKDGDTLIIKEGTYDDININIKKSLTIIGVGKKQDIKIPDITINKNFKINIENLTFTRPFIVYGEAELKNCISNTFKSVYISGGTIYINNCRFICKRDSLFLNSGVENIFGFSYIKNTVISGFDFGIQSEQNGYNSIENCSILKNDVGVWISSGGSTNISNSIFTNNRKDTDIRARLNIDGSVTRADGKIVFQNN